MLSYTSRIAKYVKNLELDADVYGLSMFGVGATVWTMPLMNILESGVGEPAAVLDIVDCKFLFYFLFFCSNLLSHAPLSFSSPST